MDSFGSCILSPISPSATLPGQSKTTRRSQSQGSSSPSPALLTITPSQLWRNHCEHGCASWCLGSPTFPDLASFTQSLRLLFWLPPPSHPTCCFAAFVDSVPSWLPRSQPSPATFLLCCLLSLFPLLFPSFSLGRISKSTEQVARTVQ